MKLRFNILFVNISPNYKSIQKICLIAICLLSSFILPLKSQSIKEGKANALINESSPYLLQHAYNPVNWYPWGEEALQKAADEDKLLLVSIGYASCHWCHVMEKESFQDTTVAQFMNENFISIKVDREERPDIDQLYMDAFRLIAEETGWPLNAIALPNGKPIYVVSYLPQKQWLKTLEIFNKGYTIEREKLIQQAQMLTNGVKELNFVNTEVPNKAFDQALPTEIFDNIQLGFDQELGGLNGAPKFPMPVLLESLLQYQHFKGDADALKMVSNTLDQIALGGIYDHLAGGFARYAVDEKWHIPHFEKMLYDNALLIRLYTNAYKVTKKPLYAQVVKQTIAFLIDEMRAENGLFYSALSAEAEGEEGKYYVWEKEEIDKILGEENLLFNAYYQISSAGNWENGKNILSISPSSYSDKQSKELKEAREILLKERKKRIKPAIDNKLLTSWNALMITALAEAYQTFGKKSYLETAKANASLFNTYFKENRELARNIEQEEPIPAFLEEYAYLIQANISLYQATFEETYLLEAKDITEFTLTHFQDTSSKLFYFTRNTTIKVGENLLQQIPIIDNILPSANSTMSRNLQVLGWYFDKAQYHEISQTMLKIALPRVIENSISHASWLPSLIWAIEEPYEIALVGVNAQNLSTEWAKNYLPNVVLFGGETEGSLPFMQYKLDEGKTSIYVCRNKICKRPVYQVQTALQMLD